MCSRIAVHEVEGSGAREFCYLLGYMRKVSSACWHKSVKYAWAGDKNPCFTALLIIDCRRCPSDQRSARAGRPTGRAWKKDVGHGPGRAGPGLMCNGLGRAGPPESGPCRPQITESLLLYKTASINQSSARDPSMLFIHARVKELQN